MIASRLSISAAATTGNGLSSSVYHAYVMLSSHGIASRSEDWFEAPELPFCRFAVFWYKARFTHDSLTLQAISEHQTSRP